MRRTDVYRLSGVMLWCLTYEVECMDGAQSNHSGGAQVRWQVLHPHRRHEWREGADLLALYERIRTQTGSTGAAVLRARQCQGCRIELFGKELAAVRNADPHEVVRCDNCGRILVRTAESGL